LFKNFESIRPGKKYIQQRGVKLPGEKHVRSFSIIMRDSDAMPIFSQCTFDRAGNSVVIFDDQYIHVWRTIEPLKTIRSTAVLINDQDDDFRFAHHYSAASLV
jgi:hypothetical protein